MATRRRILVVEDDPDLRTLLKEVLVSRGYKVSTAVDGHDAVRKCIRIPFALVITDLRLPKLNGLEVARTVQNGPRAPKVILMTAYPVWKFQAEMSDLRVLAVLGKPFDLAGLLQTIENALEGPEKYVGDPRPENP